MLAAGTLPEGYTVKKRRLVKVGTAKAAKNKSNAGRLPEAA
jgi:hypothetical protein